MMRPWKAVAGVLLAICVLGVLWVGFATLSGGAPSYAAKLRQCTRVEMEYQPSALEYFEILAAHPGLLSPDEHAYLQSLKTSIVTDLPSIQRVADTLSWTPYSVTLRRELKKQTCLRMRGYRDGQCLASFGIYDRAHVVTDEGQTFELLARPDVPSALFEFNSFSARSHCAQQLLSFSQALFCGPGGAQMHVDASEWCETIWPVGRPRSEDFLGRAPSQEEIRRQRVREAEGSGQYRCPSAGEGRCHYAMNPDCGEYSPPDTVLIFETSAGWNQHGGPELFTFDHHSGPRGGCVLLNDGTVRFIRTEEELKQLRWK